MFDVHRSFSLDPKECCTALADEIVLHRVEREFQDYADPRIVYRSFTEQGLFMGMIKNERYESKYFCESFNNVKRAYDEVDIMPVFDEVYDWISDSTRDTAQLEKMVWYDNAEAAILGVLENNFPKKWAKIRELPHLFFRAYDEVGIPISHIVNGHAMKLVGRGKNWLVGKPRGFPTEFEVREISKGVVVEVRS